MNEIREFRCWNRSAICRCVFDFLGIMIPRKVMDLIREEEEEEEERCGDVNRFVNSPNRLSHFWKFSATIYFTYNAKLLTFSTIVSNRPTYNNNRIFHRYLIHLEFRNQSFELALSKLILNWMWWEGSGCRKLKSSKSYIFSGWYSNILNEILLSRW